MQLVDWQVAAGTAARLVPPGPRLPLEEAVAVVDQLRELAHEADAHVRRYTLLDAGAGGQSPVAVVDRPGWIRSNVNGFRDLLDPVLETLTEQRRTPVGPVMSAVGPRAAGLEVGGLLAYLATRVLGQFELLGPALTDGVPGGRLTAAMASQLSDASAALLIASADAVRTHALVPRARIHHLSVRGADPVWMLTAPIPATAHALGKTGLSLDDIDLVEINEAFASVVIAWQKETSADLAKVNVNGGAIALGHPLGATGARLMTTLLYELERTGGRYGLQTMCEGGGQANVTIIERL